MVSTGTDYLDEIAATLREGRRQWKRGDNLLSAFGYVRRRQTAIDLINDELRRRGMRTDPEITTSMPLDSSITFYLNDDSGVSSPRLQPTVEEEMEAEREAVEDPVVLKVSDVALTVANLEASDREPMSVTPNSSVSEALTKMELNKYSQLVVKTGPRDVQGTVSFRSIARAQVNDVQTEVRNCLDEPVPQVRFETPLLEVVAHFRSFDSVLVFGPDRTVRGIVTPADIAAEFGGMAEPFLLIGEIENLLRWLLRRRDVDISGARGARSISAAPAPAALEDLTLGDIQHVLQQEEAWATLSVPYHRTTVCRELDDVRHVRNSVMHFREPPSDEQMTKLRSFESLLKRMCQSAARA